MSDSLLLDGCDFEHWLVADKDPEGDPTRDQIIDSYINTLALIFGRQITPSRLDAILLLEPLCLKKKPLCYKLPGVLWVVPDSYTDVKNKDYGGEPFIDGKAVPYDPKYHEDWIRNNARANERKRRNERRRNFDTYQSGPGPSNHAPNAGG